MRHNITKTFAFCLLSLAVIGCNMRKGNNANSIKGDKVEASASVSRADSTLKVANNKTISTHDSIAFKASSKKKVVNKQLADLKRRTISKYFANCDSDTLTVGRARLAVPSGAMTRPRVLSITPLKKGEIAQLPTGMVNVTGNCGSMMAASDTVAGYRFLPHGNHFSRHMASITVPYDSTLIPKGYTVDDIHTYFYDEMKHQWTMLKSTGVDKENEVAMAETSHFTDVINGIIKVPESPETQSYVPTGIKDLKAADPSAGIQQIEAPTPNQNGTANIAYTFETPAGRNNIAASAGLQYSSDGSSSYVGYGWSLPVTSIDIETRWGVPRFDEKYESESYLLMGQQLNDRLYRRTDSLERSSDKQFYPTIEGSFNKIIRKGNSPANYYWEVTAKDGTIYSYGGYNGQVSDSTTIRDSKNNIIKWALQRITDVHGNFAAFHYQKAGNNLYPSRYTWTGYKEEEGLFSIEFEIDSISDERVDVTRNGRLGLLQTDAALLKKVIVKNNGMQLRAYKPNYETGPFGKTLLKSMDQLDSEDNLVASQSFDYYNDVEKGLFADDVITYTADADSYGKSISNKHLSLLGVGSAKNNTVGGGLMVGAGWGPATASAGASYSYSSSGNEGHVTIIDINGDGLPDKVWKGNDGKLHYRLNLNRDFDHSTFGEVRDITGINSFSVGTTASKTLSVDVATGFGPVSAGYSKGKTTERTETKVYFHDFNGDGLVDIANNGLVFFNHSDGENVSFLSTSSDTGNPIISKSVVLDKSFIPDTVAIRDSLQRQYPLHDVVRLWRAPFDGRVKINSVVRKQKSGGDGVKLSMMHLKQASVQMDKNDTYTYRRDIKLWNDELQGGELKVPEKEFDVTADDYILFRVGAKYSGQDDEIQWDPVIEYTYITQNFLRKSDFPEKKEEVYFAPLKAETIGGENIVRYQSSNDSIQGEDSRAELTVDGEVSISGTYSKEKTSDDVILMVLRTNKDEKVKPEVIDSLLLPADAVFTNEAYEKKFQAIAKDSAMIDFVMKSHSPINWQKVNWAPEFNTGLSVHKIAPQRLMFNKSIILYEDTLVRKDVVDTSDTWEEGFEIIPVLRVTRLAEKDVADADVYMTIKDEWGNFLLNSQFRITRYNRVLTNGPIKVNGDLAKKFAKGKIQVSFSIMNELERNLKSDIAYIDIYRNQNIYSMVDGNLVKTGTESKNVDCISASVYSSFNRFDYGPLYRGWGQFAWKGGEESGSPQVYKENEIAYRKMKAQDSNGCINEDGSFDRDKIENGHSFITDQDFFTMAYSVDRSRYLSSTDSAYVGAIVMRPSRLGADDIVVEKIDYEAKDDGRLFAPIQKMESNSKSEAYNGKIASIGADKSTTEQESFNIVSLMDINGDGYPDWLNRDDNKTLIQLTTPVGSLSKEKLEYDIAGNLIQSETSNIGLNASFEGPISKGSDYSDLPSRGVISDFLKALSFMHADNRRTMVLNGASASGAALEGACSISGNYSNGTGETVRDWNDLNGDGLPDMVSKGSVRYNLGYCFTEEMPTSLNALETSVNRNYGAGLGASVKILGRYGISGGINMGESVSFTTGSMIDANGDGLPDYVSQNEDGNLSVLINTGSGFSNPTSLAKDANIAGNIGSSVAYYGSISYTFTIPLPFGFRINITPSIQLSHSESVSRNTASFMDMDADGLPDIVYSDDENTLYVRRNLSGRTNKLKSVTLPFGGRFTIAYEQTKPSFEHPGRQWVMSAVESIGGYEENGAVASKNSFEYEGGYRDRRERDFFGFRTVRTNQHDTQNEDAIYRYSVQTYANNHDYYCHSLVTSEALFNAKGEKLQESVYGYVPRKMQQNGEVVFPQLATLVQSTFVEGCKDSLSTKVENTYDDFGNLVAYKEVRVENDEVSGESVELEAEIEYHKDLGKDTKRYIVSVPKRIKVTGGEKLYRERETVADGFGQITKITMKNDTSESVFDMEYDEYGNVVKAIKPENYRKQRMFHEYKYDDKYHTLLTSVKDAFGYTSRTSYNDLWLAPDTTIDLNGERMEYAYDALGRPTTIRAPYEIESGVPFTIKYEYDAANRLAHTTHFSQEGNIDTYTFADSLMRAVQTKVTGVIWNGTRNEKVSIVSGRAVVDAFGRNVAAYYPTTESLGNITKYSRAIGDPVSTTQYDAQDHPIEVRLADGATTKSEYAIVARDGENMLETTVTDALNHHAESYADAKGRNRATVQHSENGEIVVSYDYDPVGQVLAVHHPNGSTTTYEYDLLGQKTKINHPDAGEVECTYDAAGNLIKKLTAQIKKTISADAGITYTYEYNRLKEVLYPENLFNRVTYTYGKPGEKYGRAGRLVLVEDASGGEAYYYGKMGEVTKTVRTVMASLSDIRTYIYGATYDSWNRVRTMTYPDGEVVTYHYNEAGQIESLSSNKLGKESVIVEKIGYDKDGHTVYTKLGNGTETTYAYDKQRERLQSMILKAGEDCIMQNNYSYDAVDNIDSIINVGVGRSGLGGTSTHRYTYDMLNRLTSANGSAKDINYAMSMTFGKMSEPLTKVQTVDSTAVAQSYNLAYKYESAEHPTAPTQIGHEHYTYDANGNPILVENDSTSATREMFWDEDNRLMVLSDNGKTSRYTYNAGGERIIKSHGSMEGVYINGAPQGITFHETDEFTLYPASIITVNRHRFTKHYFIGDKRVASRLGLGEFRNVYGSNGSNVTAGQQDYAERMNQIENQREAYYRKAGVAPGLPTMKGSYADPEVTGVGYNVLIDSLGDHSVPENWVQHPVVNTEAGTNPGAPLAWGSPENPDDAVAGYGYVPCDTSEVEETFYYHSDHLGSTAYITDQQANVTQYDAYLPYGELLVDEHSSSADLPYKFNGKELDEETGLYYYGARYMNPVTSMWYGVDPLTEQYVNIGAYIYCHGNPIRLYDINGMEDDEPIIGLTFSLGFRIGVSVDKFDADVDFGSVNYSWNPAGEGESFRSTGFGVGALLIGFESRNIYTDKTEKTGVKSMALGEITEHVETVTNTNQFNFGPSMLGLAIGEEKETVQRSSILNTEISSDKKYFIRSFGSQNQNEGKNSVNKFRKKSKVASVSCIIGVSVDVDYNALKKKVDSCNVMERLSETYNKVSNKVSNKYKEVKNAVSDFIDKIF